jgi:hypothetical protein
MISDTSGNISEAASNAGMVVTAFNYFAPAADGGLLVGTRGDGRYSRNLIYQFNARTGAGISQGPARASGGRVTNNNVPNVNNNSGTDIVEVGAFPTSVTGTVQAIAVSLPSIYAVTNTGLLVEYNPFTRLVVNRQTIRDANGIPVNLTGLTLGPDSVENGAYATTLFASDNLGNVYAIATGPNVIDPNANWGDPVPFFVDGQSILATGLPAVAITFGTLQRNLWSTTGNRATDADHILNASLDGTRTQAPGGSSLYFGNQVGGPTAGNKNDLGAQATVPEIFNYDFPGGAHGTFLSNTFSLEGYSATDKPTLYFTYFVQTDSNDYIPGVRPQSDAIRVYVGDGTNWVLAATNDSYRGPLAGDDEQDLGPNGVTTYPTQQALPDVVEIFDEGTSAWRQARVDLSSFAGRSDLRLRFEFASSGAVNVGDITTVGEEMFARPGSRLRDGQSFILEGCNQFEVDLGYTLIVPNYEQIAEGETIQIDVTDPTTAVTESYTFEFDKVGDGVAATSILVRIDSSMSSAEIARKLENAILETALTGVTSFTQLRGHRNGNRLNLTRHPVDEPIATDGIALVQSTGAGVLVEGAPGVTPGTTAVTIYSTMSPNQVAKAIKVSLASHLLPAGTYREAEFNNAADPLLATDLEVFAWSAAANNTISLNNPNPLPHITMHWKFRPGRRD